MALKSHIIKTLERLVLEQLRPMVRPHLDPLQFAYQPWLGVEDTMIYLLNRVYAHLHKPSRLVRVTFFYFSGAFNTIRAALLGKKLTAIQVDAPVVSWIVNCLTGRPQYVCLQHCVSDTMVRNTGAPQGTALSPSSSPSTIQTSATKQSPAISRSFLMMTLDVSARVRMLNAVVGNFDTWCEQNHLQLNTTKELGVDLRRVRTPKTPVFPSRGSAWTLWRSINIWECS